MTTTKTTKTPMDYTRKAALYAGLFYIATFVFSIPALGLYDGVVNDANFVLGSGSDDGVLWGGLIEVLTGLTGIGTAVALYPVLKRYGPGRAAGFVASRTLEAAMIFTGVLAVLAVFTLRQGGGDATALTTVTDGLVAVKDWTFLLGPGVMPAINALCFATIMYKTEMLPRWIPVAGLIGAPMLLLSSTVTLFGGWEQVTVVSMLMALPIATWELSAGAYMAVKGFRTPAVAEVEVDEAPVVPAERAVLAPA
jgi:hypothetical protein